jgi:predicted nucleotidyltransferase
MIDPNNPLRQVDLFVESPIEFDSLIARAKTVRLATTEVRVASIPDLIAMKQIAGRPQDHTDIEALRAILAKEQS